MQNLNKGSKLMLDYYIATIIVEVMGKACEPDCRTDSKSCVFKFSYFVQTILCLTI